MINTYSKFLYGFTITQDNNSIDFVESSGTLTALVDVGSYTATTICQAIADAMNAEGLLTYTVTFNRTTRKFTIAATGNFQLLSLTGPTVGAGIYEALGFSTTANTSSATSHVSDTAAGTVYAPQYWLQDYVSTDHFQQSVDATVNKSASGKVEVYRVGIEKFCELNIKWITDMNTSGTVINNNASGVSDALSFLQFLVTKAPFEFMPDEDQPGTFQTFILESTAQSSNGTGYKLDEQYERGLAGFYETGKLKMRLIE